METAAAFFEDCAPKKHRPSQRDQTEKRAQEIIPAIYERVLQSDVKNGGVLGDVHATENLIRKSGNRKQEKTKATKVLLTS
jgi:hypothetical protein